MGVFVCLCACVSLRVPRFLAVLQGNPKEHHHLSFLSLILFFGGVLCLDLPSTSGFDTRQETRGLSFLVESNSETRSKTHQAGCHVDLSSFLFGMTHMKLSRSGEPMGVSF